MQNANPASTTRNGFTLIELMIVVAIIGILASIGIANFRTFQLRSKLVEARGNLKAMATAENSYYAEQGTYLAAAATPAGAPTPGQRAWAGGGIASFNIIGYRPEGGLRFQYAIDTNGTRTDFIAAALGDLDGNGIFSDFAYVHPAPAAPAGPPSTLALGCAGAGVVDPNQPAGAFNVVGPCANADGRTEF